jgi:hypothetical protein
MKISKKNVIFIAAVLILCLGVANIIHEISAIRRDVVLSRVDNEEYISQLYAAQAEEIQATAGNTVTIEGFDIVLGKTTLQEFLSETGCSIDKDRSYYYSHDYDGYRYMTKNELDAETSLDSIGWGMAYVYKSDKTSDIALDISSCEYTDEKSRVLPDYDRCYIVSVEIQQIGKKDYTFSYNGVDQTSTHEDYTEAWNDGEDMEPEYESDYYKQYRWKTGRNVTVRETVYTQEGQELYNCERQIEISYDNY